LPVMNRCSLPVAGFTMSELLEPHMVCENAEGDVHTTMAAAIQEITGFVFM
jgi:hypothetical protein